MEESGAPSADRRSALVADCSQCFGLCCVALSFPRSAQFAFDKDADDPCRNLLADFGCRTYGTLRADGMRGCTEYTCYGAGQKVAQVTYGGQDWRRSPATAAPMFRVFRSMRRLHEILWFLAEAMERCSAGPDRDRLTTAFNEIEQLTLMAGGELDALADAAGRAAIKLLGSFSDSLRSGSRTRGEATVLRGALRMGANLRKADLAHADLRGAVLIGSDLRGADLRGADVLFADLRATKLHGADLSDALFLTQSQLDQAEGDASTVVSAPLRPSAQWAS